MLTQQLHNLSVRTILYLLQNDQIFNFTVCCRANTSQKGRLLFLSRDIITEAEMIKQFLIRIKTIDRRVKCTHRSDDHGRNFNVFTMILLRNRTEFEDLVATAKSAISTCIVRSNTQGPFHQPVAPHTPRAADGRTRPPRPLASRDHSSRADTVIIRGPSHTARPTRHRRQGTTHGRRRAPHSHRT